ncbi:hypothetical protein Syun_003544 [Stephania yunnanensis]|uniref:Copia protein n=1 Tax=Stephania yunnanensis TaxID=152371 RepID=A0AAP0L1B0_9MAGN
MLMKSLSVGTIQFKFVDFGVSHPHPVHLFCDNQATLHIAANPVYYKHTKYIEIDCHFIQQHIESKTLLPRAISSQHQLADTFTKALGRDRLRFLLGKLGIHNVNALT